MAYAITRRAYNEAWSGRTAKVTRQPLETLAGAVRFAIDHTKGSPELTITDTEAGLSGTVARYHSNGRSVVTFAFPEEWAALIRIV
jgi:hypothetical protein